MTDHPEGPSPEVRSPELATWIRTLIDDPEAERDSRVFELHATSCTDGLDDVEGRNDGDDG